MSHDAAPLSLVWFGCIVVLVSESSRGIVIGSMLSYLTRLHGKDLLGTTVALFSVGRLVYSMVSGWLTKYLKPITVMEIAVMMNLVGALLYFFANEWGLWALITGRTCLGFGSGVLSVSRTVVAHGTSKEQRTRYISILDACRFIGYSVTCAIGWALGYVNITVRGFVLDGLTAPGFFLVLVNAGLMLYSRLVLRRRIREAERGARDVSDGVAASAVLVDAKPQNAQQRMLMLLGCGVLITVNAVARGNIALLESIGTPMFREAALTNPDGTMDSDAEQDTSEFFLALGSVGLFVYWLLATNRIKLDELHLLTLIFVLSAVGSLFLMTNGTVALWRVIVGGGLIWSVCSPLSGAVTVSTFSKLVGDQPQGSFMSAITAAGNLGRIIFPVLADQMSPVGILSLAVVLSVLCAALIQWFKRYAARCRFSIDDSRPVYSPLSDVDAAEAEEDGVSLRRDKADVEMVPLAGRATAA